MPKQDDESTTARIRKSLQKCLAEMAEATGFSQQQILEAAIYEKLQRSKQEGKMTIEAPIASTASAGKKGAKESAGSTVDQIVTKPLPPKKTQPNPAPKP